MQSEYKHLRLWTLIAAASITCSLGTPALAIDDGARAYWNGKDGTDGLSFQFLRGDMDASGSQQFAPDQYIYPNSDVEANLAIATWAHHFTLLDRASAFSINLIGGNVDVEGNANDAPGQFLPPGIADGSSLSQSSSGYADPSMQLVANLYGTPRLKSNVDLLNYEPTWTVDIATMLGVPVGEYDGDKLVNLGLNRWYARVAVPIKYHFGVFTRGYMSSLEIIPSVWIFDDNDDFLGQTLANDPLLQLEAHLTHDFTPTLFGSLDMLYRGGFQSKIGGVEAGDELDIGDVGFTLGYQLTDNTSVRTGYSANVFGDDNLDTSLIRIQFVYGWHQSDENAKKLQHGH
jgi:hypothetical protein